MPYINYSGAPCGQCGKHGEHKTTCHHCGRGEHIAQLSFKDFQASKQFIEEDTPYNEFEGTYRGYVYLVGENIGEARTSHLNEKERYDLEYRSAWGEDAPSHLLPYFHIVQVDSPYDEDEDKGHWLLTIEQESIYGDQLEALEHILYEWVCGELFLDEIGLDEFHYGQPANPYATACDDSECECRREPSWPDNLPCTKTQPLEEKE